MASSATRPSASVGAALTCRVRPRRHASSSRPSVSKKVVLAGLKVPPNYGAEYAGAFEKIYTDLAAKYKLPIVGFLLEGVAG